MYREELEAAVSRAESLELEIKELSEELRLQRLYTEAAGIRCVNLADEKDKAQKELLKLQSSRTLQCQINNCITKPAIIPFVISLLAFTVSYSLSSTLIYLYLLVN